MEGRWKGVSGPGEAVFCPDSLPVTTVGASALSPEGSWQTTKDPGGGPESARDAAVIGRQAVGGRRVRRSHIAVPTHTGSPGDPPLVAPRHPTGPVVSPALPASSLPSQLSHQPHFLLSRHPVSSLILWLLHRLHPMHRPGASNLDGERRALARVRQPASTLALPRAATLLFKLVSEHTPDLGRILRDESGGRRKNPTPVIPRPAHGRQLATNLLSPLPQVTKGDFFSFFLLISAILKMFWEIYQRANRSLQSLSPSARRQRRDE